MNSFFELELFPQCLCKFLMCCITAPPANLHSCLELKPCHCPSREAGTSCPCITPHLPINSIWLHPTRPSRLVISTHKVLTLLASGSSALLVIYNDSIPSSCELPMVTHPSTRIRVSHITCVSLESTLSNTLMC